MSLVKTGGGVTDISGSIAGNVFARDSSGLHARAAPRRVKQRTPAQHDQRNAFAKARMYSKDNRTVSYLIYRALNNLPFIFDAFVTGDPNPNCTGRYIRAGLHAGEDYYERADSAWFIWYFIDHDVWYISSVLGVVTPHRWLNEKGFEGGYNPRGLSTGDVIVELRIAPPPLDYQPPSLQEPK